MAEEVAESRERAESLQVEHDRAVKEAGAYTRPLFSST